MLVSGEEEDVRVLVNFGFWLLQVDNQGRLRQGRALVVYPHMFKQSLVRSTFFPKLAGYASNASVFV